jgi:hypothetical protein
MCGGVIEKWQFAKALSGGGGTAVCQGSLVPSCLLHIDPKEGISNYYAAAAAAAAARCSSKKCYN